MGKFDREIDMIAASGFFDRAWYLAEHPDVKAVGLDPIEHYLLIGAALLRDPSPKFSTKEYLDRQPDVQASGANPLLHFLTNRAPKPSWLSGCEGYRGACHGSALNNE